MVVGDVDAVSGFTISPEVYMQEIEGECILLDLRSGFYFGLNAVGMRIWALLSAGKSFTEIVATIETEFDAPAGVVRVDARRLIDELYGKGLLT